MYAAIQLSADELIHSEFFYSLSWTFGRSSPADYDPTRHVLQLMCLQAFKFMRQIPAGCGESVAGVTVGVGAHRTSVPAPSMLIVLQAV